MLNAWQFCTIFIGMKLDMFIYPLIASILYTSIRRSVKKSIDERKKIQPVPNSLAGMVVVRLYGQVFVMKNPLKSVAALNDELEKLKVFSYATTRCMPDVNVEDAKESFTIHSRLFPSSKRISPITGDQLSSIFFGCPLELKFAIIEVLTTGSTTWMTTAERRMVDKAIRKVKSRKNDCIKSR